MVKTSMNYFANISSVSRRLFAYFLDCIILIIVLFFLGIILSFLLVDQHSPMLLSPTNYFYNVLNTSIHCLYFSYFLSSKNQASLGQQLLGIHTISCGNDNRISYKLAFDRTISQFLIPTMLLIINSILKEHINLESMPLLQFIFIICMFIIIVIFIALSVAWYLTALFSPDRQTFHDKIFNTVVIQGKFNRNLIKKL